MMFLVDETRWTNQRGELVRIGAAHEHLLLTGPTDRMTEPPSSISERASSRCTTRTAGHEKEFNRYYERDHMYARRDPRAVDDRGAALRRHRGPEGDCATRASGPSVPIDDGSYLTMYWIDEGKLDDAAGVGERADEAARRGGPHVRRALGADRDRATTTSGRGERDADGVPPFLALDRRYAGVVWAVLERAGDASVGDLAAWLADDFLPTRFAARRSRSAPCSRRGPRSRGGRRPRPRCPASASACSSRSSSKTDVREALARAVRRPRRRARAPPGRCRTLMVAPFIPTIPGTDTYTDQSVTDTWTRTLGRHQWRCVDSAIIGIATRDVASWRSLMVDVLGVGESAGPAGANGDTLYLKMDDRTLAHRGASAARTRRVRVRGLGAVRRDDEFDDDGRAPAALGRQGRPGTDALRAARGVHDVAQFDDPFGNHHELFYGADDRRVRVRAAARWLRASSPTASVSATCSTSCLRAPTRSTSSAGSWASGSPTSSRGAPTARCSCARRRATTASRTSTCRSRAGPASTTS